MPGVALPRSLPIETRASLPPNANGDRKDNGVDVNSGRDTIRLLELYLHWLSAADQRRWFAENGEALRKAVFGWPSGEVA